MSRYRQYPNLEPMQTAGKTLSNWPLYPSLPPEEKLGRLEAGYTRAGYLTQPPGSPDQGVFLPQTRLLPRSPTCPACRVGWLETEYSYLCACWALCCFPLGLGKHRRCNNCNAYF